jgi:uncharacterized protein YdhG (YjbR/CyaY superfamily)
VKQSSAERPDLRRPRATRDQLLRASRTAVHARYRAHEATTPRGRQVTLLACAGRRRGRDPGPVVLFRLSLLARMAFRAHLTQPQRSRRLIDLPGEFIRQVETPPGESPVSGDALLPRLRSLPARLIGQHNGAVSAQQIDLYLDALEEPKRTTLAQLRQMILDILPEAEQGISYWRPGLQGPGEDNRGVRRVQEPSELPAAQRLRLSPSDRGAHGYPTSSGALRFSIDQPLPRSLVEKLIAVRLRQACPA